MGDDRPPPSGGRRPEDRDDLAMRVVTDPQTPMDLRLAILTALGEGKALVGFDAGMTTRQET